MNEINWYKKQMENPDLPTYKYLEYFNIVKDMEFRAACIYNQRMAELDKQR